MSRSTSPLNRVTPNTNQDNPKTNEFNNNNTANQTPFANFRFNPILDQLYMNRIALRLAEYPNFPLVEFEEVRGTPCLDCVCKLDISLRFNCIVKRDVDRKCIVCYEKADAELQIPNELRGPALYYWNKLKFFLSVLARGENLSSPINRPHNLIYNAGEAQGAITGHLWNPEPIVLDLSKLAEYSAQETISGERMRNILSRQSSGPRVPYRVHQQRMENVQPRYLQNPNDKLIARLRIALRSLNDILPIETHKLDEYETTPEDLTLILPKPLRNKFEENYKKAPLS
ncbi:hypothetical protein ACLX1H_008874 [Fusarium chlamydosporum]